MSRTWDVAIVGAGYVGLPLAQTFADAGKRVLILDVVPEVVDSSTTSCPGWRFAAIECDARSI